MKHANKSLTYLISAIALLTLSGGAFAFGGYGGYGGYGGHDSHGRHGGCHGGSPMRAVYRLPDLTDAQRTQLDTLHKEERSRMRTEADAMRDSQRKLHDAIADDADKAAIRTLAEKQGTLVTHMIMARVDARARIEAILTAKQLKELHFRGGMGPAGTAK